MRYEHVIGDAIKFLANVALVDVAIFVVVALVCWFAGWHTLDHYGLGLTLAGALAIAAGGSSLVGSPGLAQRPRYAYADNAYERAGLWVGSTGGHKFLALMATAGLVSIVFGQVIQGSVT